MSAPDLSISIIAKNEIECLPRLFESLLELRDICRLQIVVADTGSTDGTEKYVARNGAEVYHFKWVNDFSQARNFSISKCTADWIIWLDADDSLPGSTIKWLAENIWKLDKTKVYMFKIVSQHSNGTRSSFIQTRLFPNLENLSFSGAIHESLTPSIKSQGLSGVNTGLEIHHSGYKNDDVLQIKKNRNKDVLEQIIKSDEPSASVIFSLARQYQSEEKYIEALSLFAKIISDNNISFVQNDIYVAAHIYIGQILGFQNKINEAKKFFEENLEKGESNPQFLFEFGKLLYVSGEKARASELLSKAKNLPSLDWTIPTDWDSIYKGITEVLHRIVKELEDMPAVDTDTFTSVGSNVREMQKMISICSIIRDEEDNIEELCRQLPLNEIDWVVVDTGSSDNSCEVLKKYGIGVRNFNWCNDFSAARNYSLQFATRPIIIWLDADDRLPENFWTSLAGNLRELVNSEKTINRAVRFIVECTRDTGEREFFRQIRLFPNYKGVVFEGKIHEQLRTSLERNVIEIVDVDITLVHFGYFKKESREIKLQRNFKMLREEVQTYPDDPSVVMEYGNTLFQKENYSEAAQTYLGYLQKHGLENLQSPPQNEVVKSYPVLIANAFDKKGDKEKAEHWYHKARLWNADDFFPAYWLGKHALLRSDLETALTCFKEIIERPIKITNIASDQHSIQRNALGFMVLCQMNLSPRPDDDIRKHLSILIKGGLETFPVDYKVPIEFYKSTNSLDELEDYYSMYLKVFNHDIAIWEDFMEILVQQKKYEMVRKLYSQNSGLNMQSGVLEAFHGKSYETCTEKKGFNNNNKPYEIYLNALKTFPQEPTLLAYFADWVNKCRNFHEVYGDLQNLKSRSEELNKLYLQLEKLI